MFGTPNIHLSQVLLNTPNEHFIETVPVEPETLRLPVATLAKQFGVTRQTIHKWLKEYPSKITPKDRFIKIVNSDPHSLQFPVATLSKQFGVNQRTVHRWLKEYPSVKCPKDRFMATVSSEPETLRVPIAALAKQFGVTQQTVRKWLKEYENHQLFMQQNDIDEPNSALTGKYKVSNKTMNTWKTEVDHQWLSWHEEVEQAMGIVQQPIEKGFKPPKPIPSTSLFPYSICCECVILLFECDVQWVSAVERNPQFRASAFEGLSFQLEIVTRQRGNVTQVTCCRHCSNLHGSSEQLFDDFGNIPACIQDASDFGNSRRLAVGSLYCSTFKRSNYSYTSSHLNVGLL